MSDAKNLFWIVDAAKPAKWGKERTEEEKEDFKKEKHTPGKKKKRGRSQIKFERSPGRYAGRDRPGVAEEKGRRCGKSWIAKEDDCHLNDADIPKPRPAKKAKPPKKPRTRVVKPEERKPGGSSSEDTPHDQSDLHETPEVVSSPEGGKGVLVGEGYLEGGEDGLYEMEGGANRVHRVYMPEEEDQARAQYLSSAIASIMGLAAPDDYLFRNTPIDDRVAVAHPVVPFSELDEMMLRRLSKTSPEVAGWFVHSVLVRHETVLGPQMNNMVLRKDGHVSVLSFGGTLLWTDDGERKPDGMSEGELVELDSLREGPVFSELSDEAVAAAVTMYVAHLQDKYILDLVDAAQFEPDDRKAIGKGLVMRKRLLEYLTGDTSDEAEDVGEDGDDSEQ